jgi:hypothetical protein
MRLSPFNLTFFFELCLLGLATNNFLGDLLLWDLFGDFIPKRENVGPKQVSVSKVGRGKICVNIGREDQKGGSLIYGEFG